jgi:recombination protein RecT
MENNPTNQNAVTLTVKSLFSKDSVKAKFEELLGKNSAGFITSVLQAVASNDLLKQADPNTVFHAAAVAATLNLPINNNLGFAYIVPYKEKSGRVVAQFQMGYKGFIQLAQRSGQFKTISESPIYEGQLVEENPLTGFRFDFTKKTSDKIIGYAAYMELLNGFTKTWYARVEDIDAHGKRYSQNYKKWGTGLWKDNFDAMARKTGLKLMLSKYAPLSIEMQKAIVTDQAVINDVAAEDVTYVDNTAELAEGEQQDAETTEAVNAAMDSLETVKANTKIRNQIRALEKKQDGMEPDSTSYLSIQQEIEELEKQIVKA